MIQYFKSLLIFVVDDELLRILSILNWKVFIVMLLNLYFLYHLRWGDSKRLLGEAGYSRSNHWATSQQNQKGNVTYIAKSWNKGHKQCCRSPKRNIYENGKIPYLCGVSLVQHYHNDKGNHCAANSIEEKEKALGKSSVPWSAVAAELRRHEHTHWKDCWGYEKDVCDSFAREFEKPQLEGYTAKLTESINKSVDIDVHCELVE